VQRTLSNADTQTRFACIHVHLHIMRHVRPFCRSVVSLWSHCKAIPHETRTSVVLVVIIALV
jgi:hypothetical protein